MRPPPPGPRGGRVRRLTSTGPDAGINLTELTIAMAVGSLLLVLLTGVYTSGLRTTSTITAKVSATADVAHATDVMARRLRVAVAPSATVPAIAGTAGMQGGRISFYASLATSATATVDPIPTLVTYEYDTARRCLTETLTPGTGAAPYTFPASAARTTCLVRGDVTGGDGPIFTYYTSATGTTTTAVPASARSVGVSFAVTQTSGSGSAVTRDGVRALLENVGT